LDRAVINAKFLPKKMGIVDKRIDKLLGLRTWTGTLTLLCTYLGSISQRFVNSGVLIHFDNLGPRLQRELRSLKQKRTISGC
jgi:hypothetical protein